MITLVSPFEWGHDVKHCMINLTFMARELMKVEIPEFSLGNHYTMEASKAVTFKLEYHVT